MNVTIIGGTTNIDLGNFSGTSWQLHTHTFTPTDNSLVLTFSSTTSNDGGNFLDAVSLKDTGTNTDVVVNGGFELFQTGSIGDTGEKGIKGQKGETELGEKVKKEITHKDLEVLRGPHQKVVQVVKV